VGRRIKEECPDGVDIFFDNVGGDILDSALVNMAQHGRIVLCGGISRYNEKDLPPGPRNYMELTVRRCRMEGFIVIDFFSRIPEAVADLARWIGEGKIVVESDVQEGIENVPRTFLRLFSGENLGKQLCKLADAAPGI
jgi:NADPH-dependent curcumin reductase CurA